MSDHSFLNWPFVDENHRTFAFQLEEWSITELSCISTEASNVHRTCQRLILKLSEAGWLVYCVSKKYEGWNPKFDVPSLCLIRESLARFSGLANFVFAMSETGERNNFTFWFSKAAIKISS